MEEEKDPAGKREAGGTPPLKKAGPATLLWMLPVAAAVYFAVWPEDGAFLWDGLIGEALPWVVKAAGPVLGAAAAIAAAYYGAACAWLVVKAKATSAGRALLAACGSPMLGFAASAARAAIGAVDWPAQGLHVMFWAVLIVGLLLVTPGLLFCLGINDVWNRSDISRALAAPIPKRLAARACALGAPSAPYIEGPIPDGTLSDIDEYEGYLWIADAKGGEKRQGRASDAAFSFYWQRRATKRQKTVEFRLHLHSHGNDGEQWDDDILKAKADSGKKSEGVRDE